MFPPGVMNGACRQPYRPFPARLAQLLMTGASPKGTKTDKGTLNKQASQAPGIPGWGGGSKMFETEQRHFGLSLLPENQDARGG
jgi:hypothetical protein